MPHALPVHLPETARRAEFRHAVASQPVVVALVEHVAYRRALADRAGSRGESAAAARWEELALGGAHRLALLVDALVDRLGRG
jgi:hypothetical protein